MNLVTLDFETYYDSDYTLSKMTTEEYIRDPRFKTHCVGAGYPSGTYVWKDIRLAGVPFQAELPGSAVLCHHAHFDGLILAHHYGIKPAFWFDTLSMARLVVPHLKSHALEALAQHFNLLAKTVPYNLFKGVRDLPPEIYSQVAAGCAQDVELTYQIYQKLIPYVPQQELRIIDLTVRMFAEPALVLDRPLMEWYAQVLQERKQTLLAQLGVDKTTLGSNDKFAALLRELGVEPPTKVSPTTKQEIYAFAKTDTGMQELLEHGNDTIALLAEARVDTKSTGTQTRAQRLLGMDSRGPLCVYLNYAGAHTLRDSGGDAMNWQNFKRLDYGGDGKPLMTAEQRGMVRLCIKAPPGYQVVVVDASQIECRLLNWVAGQQDVLDKFATGKDLYSELASLFYGWNVTKANKPERGTGKQLELSCGYGAGGDTIVRTARLGTYGPPVMLSPAQGLQARDLYRSTHPQVKALWKQAENWLHLLHGGERAFLDPARPEIGRISNKYIYGPDETRLDFSHLGYDHAEKQWYVVGRRGKSRMYGAKLVENYIQYLARAVLMQAALQLAPYYKIVMRTHDELVYLAKTEEAPEALAFGLQVMKTPPAWCRGIPLDAEGGFDERYSK